MTGFLSVRFTIFTRIPKVLCGLEPKTASINTTGRPSQSTVPPLTSINLLANKWIELVFEDKSGMIWLGSKGGLTKYNPRRGVFTPIRHDPDASGNPFRMIR